MSAYNDLILADRPTAYWPLDEATSTPSLSPVADLSANGFNGENALLPGAGGGPAFSSSVRSWQCNGGGVIDVPGAGALPHGGGPFSYEAWIKPIDHAYGGAAPAGREFMGVFGGSVNAQTTYSWDWDGDAGQGVFRILNRAPTGIGFALAPTADLRGTWHHAVVTWDGTAVVFYLDGSPIALDSSITPSDITGLGSAYTATQARLAGAYGLVNAWSGGLDEAAMYDQALTACRVLTHYELATTGSYTPCGEWVRLAHISGHGYWQSKGDVVEEWAGGVKRVLLPFPQMAPPVEHILGQDQSTGLPMWVDPPAASSSVPVTPVTVPSPTPPVLPPAPGDHCVQTRCGAAIALQTKLVNDYDNWRQWINGAISFAIGGLIASVLAEIAAILAAAEVAAWVLQVFKIASPIIGSATVITLPTLIPAISAPQTDKLLQDFFCQMQCNAGEVAFHVGDQQEVAAAILADATMFPSDLMRELLGEIVYYDPIQDWQAAMSNAPVSDLCDGITCP